MQPNNNPDGQPRRSFIEEARRAQIVASAVEVIADVGYRNASMARIAAHAGISRGLISYHFANKAELITEVVTWVYLDGAEFMGPRIGVETTAPGQLRTYISSNLEYMRANPGRMLALVEIFTHAGRDELPQADDAETTDLMIAPLAEVCRHGQANNDFRDFDVRTMALAVRNVIDGIPPRLSEPDLDLDLVIENVVTLFDRATRHPDRQESSSCRSKARSP